MCFWSNTSGRKHSSFAISCGFCAYIFRNYEHEYAVQEVLSEIIGGVKIYGKNINLKRQDIAVFDYTDEGFDLIDNAGNRLTSDMGYRCILTICDGQIVYKY